MFDTLSNKFQDLFKKFSKGSSFTDSNISEAVKEVRLALLEADVNYSVASEFVLKIKEKALGENILKSVSPREQFIKIVHDELISLMGSDESHLSEKNKPSIYMLLGLQGVGKTTTVAKLANFFKKKNKKVMVAGLDLQRPAAFEQLKILVKDLDVETFSIENEKPKNVAKKALEKARNQNFDILILDTAGRLHIDEVLMNELIDIKEITNPDEILFVANAAFGQDAVKTAIEFNTKIGITGSILTMLDSDARAGAAISIKEVTKKPLKFETTGEKIEDIQIFNPKSMADRILGMGDVINLVKKAEEAITEEDKEDLEKKIKNASFNYEDYLKQMSMMKKMGSMKGLMKMIPGFSSMEGLDINDDELKKIEVMIKSMTKKERVEKDDLSYPRRKRIANGSGTSIDDVNRLVKGFKRIKQFLKSMPKKGSIDSLLNMKNFGGQLWR
ncbi:MAG: signal recognition particle protein [Chlamydiae bacterium RIFCSPLOWO2_01_FULL_28_7]|nr:MAG: signal recognition particle protein [Chlamydiae bacterium RIFCSPLOWO2_01_FULL_28_7]